MERKLQKLTRSFYKKPEIFATYVEYKIVPIYWLCIDPFIKYIGDNWRDNSSDIENCKQLGSHIDFCDKYYSKATEKGAHIAWAKKRVGLVGLITRFVIDLCPVTKQRNDEYMPYESTKDREKREQKEKLNVAVLEAVFDIYDKYCGFDINKVTLDNLYKIYSTITMDRVRNLFEF